MDYVALCRAPPTEVTSQEKGELMKAFQAKFDVSCAPWTCGCCEISTFGQKVMTPLLDLGRLMASKDTVDVALRCGSYFPVFNLTQYQDNWFHIDPQCVQGEEASTCKGCLVILTEEEKTTV